ncbi:MAG TPA: ATP-binding protein, partial [Gemmatimonadaceae bacterium]|nr:ATP-binding protein [Gemmatimonadaceae bacterium]
LLGLINNVLNFSKVEAGQISYTIETVLVGPLVRDTEAMIKPQMIASGLQYHSDGDDVLAVRADPEKLRQIIINLLTNSLKFTESGGEITVEWGEIGSTERSFERMAYLRVRDTGAGIDQSKLQSIFEPFVQVDEGLRRTNDGVGLGLAISRLLAREMSGELVAESELGRGSTFTLTLPRA